jgi:hypothetical protein
MIKDTLQLEISGDIEKGNCNNRKGNCFENDDVEKATKRGKGSKKESKVKNEVKEEPVKVEDSGIDVKQIEKLIREGEFNKIKVDDLKHYLKTKGLHSGGVKEELIDRVIISLTD